MIDFKAAIFDLDGTLIDSMGVWERIDTVFLQRRNIEPSLEYFTAVRTLEFQKAAEYTVSRYNLIESTEDIIKEWTEMSIDEYTHNISMKSNAKEYLTYLKENHVKIGLATASHQDLYEPVLKNNGIYELFDSFTTVCEVERGKGFPDIYLLAAKKLAVSPKDCIVFEDVLPGIQGALAANMRAYGVFDVHSEFEKEKMIELSHAFIYDFKEMMDV